MCYYDELWNEHFTQQLPKVTQNPFNLHVTSTQILVQTKLEVVEAFSNGHNIFKYNYQLQFIFLLISSSRIHGY